MARPGSLGSMSAEDKLARLQQQKRESKARRLSGSAVARSDKGREKAEAAQGRQGPVRPGGSAEAPRVKSVAEATTRVTAERVPEKSATEVARDMRPPTAGEVAMIRQLLDMACEPLSELEQDFVTVGIVGPECPPALAKTGSIAAKPKELESLSLCGAGTMVNFTPNFMLYLYPVGLILGSLGFVGSRLLVFWRINQAMKAMDKAQKAEEERRRHRGTAPTAPANGASQGAPAGPLTKLGG